MFKCNKCGDVTSELRQISCNIEGTPYYEDCLVNECSCGGDYEEAFECDDCGEYFIEDELYSGLCSECIEKHITIENVVEYAKKCDCENDLLIVLKEFIKEDISTFAEFIRSKK